MTTKKVSDYSRAFDAIHHQAILTTAPDDDFYELIKQADKIHKSLLQEKGYMFDDSRFRGKLLNVTQRMDATRAKTLSVRPQIRDKIEAEERQAVKERKEEEKKKLKEAKKAKIESKIKNDKPIITRTQLSLGGSASDIFENDVFDEQDVIDELYQPDGDY